DRLRTGLAAGLLFSFCCCPSECTGHLQTHKPLAALRACSTHKFIGPRSFVASSGQRFSGWSTPDGLMGFPAGPASFHFASRQKTTGGDVGQVVSSLSLSPKAKGTKRCRPKPKTEPSRKSCR